MHILFILNTVALFGANRSAVELACGLQKLGQESYFFIPREGKMDDRHKLKNELDKHGFKYAFLNYYPSVHFEPQKEITERIFRRKANQICLDNMKKYIEKWQIDVIHTNSLTHLIGASLSRHTSKPHVWHIRELLKLDYELIYDWFIPYKVELCKADQVICISNYVKEIHKTMLWGSHVITLKDGFHINRYIIEGGYEKNKKDYTMILCGSIQEAKGQLDAVKAVDYLVNTYHLNNIRLQIVGNGSGNYCQKIRNYMEVRNLNEYIDIVPFQSDLYELRKHADIALMCSRGEALGRVTVEAMLSENLVIGADSAGTKEIIQNKVTGYLYKTGDVKDLSKKIYEAVTHWERQERIIKNAVNYAKQEFDSEKYAYRMLEIYERICRMRMNKCM
ncbi:MAG: glycosyltransferase family 4 protein [Lachnospiraceae bacterium]|nr:glycosyltransferase family 4 protein [Lachnospiraceae bacterium]